MLALVADDQPNEEIAKREKIAPSTVEKHIENIYRKIPVTNRASAVIWYWKRRMAEVESRRREKS
jgi:DNA-binding CsgD family transcriptional regulator